MRVCSRSTQICVGLQTVVVWVQPQSIDQHLEGHSQSLDHLFSGLQELPDVREALSATEPLPALAVLDPAIQIQQGLSAKRRLSREILIFRGQAASMGLSRRQRLATYLSSALQARQQELFQGVCQLSGQYAILLA